MLTSLQHRRALIASLVANACLAALVIGLVGRQIVVRLVGRRTEIRAGLDRAPAIPYRMQPRLSMTSIRERLAGEPLEAWRRDVLTQLRALVDLPPISSGLKAEWVVQPGASNAYTLARATVPSPSGIDRIVMYRLLPTRLPSPDRKPAAVLASPGSGERGVDGLLGRVADYQRSAAVRIAERGYAVYVLETFANGERAFDVGWMRERGYTSQHVAGMYGLYSGRYLGQLFLADLLAALEVIRNDPDVDGNSIATFGISRGGHLAVMAAALAPDVKGVVSASGLRDADLYAAYYFDRAVLPGEGRYYLASDIAGTVAPRPMLITYGRRFETRGVLFGEAFELQEEVQTLRTADRVKSIYSLFGAEPNLDVTLHAEGHTWDEDSTFAFLRRLFGY